MLICRQVKEIRHFDNESIIQAIKTFLAKKLVLPTKFVNDDKTEDEINIKVVKILS